MESLKAKSADLHQPLTTLVVRGRLVHLPQVQLDELFEDLIGQGPSEMRSPKGHTFLCEDLPPKLNNVSDFTSLSPADFCDLSPRSGALGDLT